LYQNQTLKAVIMRTTEIKTTDQIKQGQEITFQGKQDGFVLEIDSNEVKFGNEDNFQWIPKQAMIGSYIREAMIQDFQN